jgi:Ca-activated chloride channel family protein
MNVRRTRVLLGACLLLLTAGIIAAGCSKQEKYQSLKAGGASMEAPPAPQATALPNPAVGTPGGGGGVGPKHRFYGRAARPAAPEGILNTLLPPQSLPSPDEELWIIQKAAAPAPAAARAAEVPGTGALVTEDPQSKQTVPVPLKHTDVKASVAGYIATVDVTQQFHNPFDGKIEAVYVFPLPGNAAINEFVMTVGERRIRGIIRERQEAEQLYNEARAHGHVASLLTQERPNVFTQRVANIEPGKSIDVSIRYFNTLTYADGWYEFVFPMVVGPRFNPPGSTDGIGAVGAGSRGASGQATEVQYLKPDQRSGHDVSLAVDLGAGVKVDQVDSRNHQIRVKRGGEGEGITRVELDPADAIPNKDFVLRYRVAGGDVKGGLIVGKDAKGQGYFTLMLVPPKDLGTLPRSPVEMFFTLDVSGSMNGKPIEQSKAAMRYALQNMRPDDTFQVVTFAGQASTLAPQPLPATKQNLEKGLRFMEAAQGSGGTMMLQGIRASLDAPADESRPRFVAFLTDGYIGNEAEILGALRGSLGQSRVFSFGVGSSPNRYLLDAMAKTGRGAVAYLGLNDDGSKVMSQYFDRVSHPALTNLRIDWGGLGVKQVFPRELPDLFVGRPVILTGKFDGAPDKAATIKVTGQVGGETRTIEIPVNATEVETAQSALPAVWARQMIADLGEQATYDPNIELPQMVKQVALEYGLMSSFTAFIAVDAATKTAGASGTTVAVPVPVPDGVKYETTVTEGQAQAIPAADR